MELMFFWVLFVLGISLTLVIYFDLVSLNTRYLFLLMLIGGIGWSVYRLKISPSDLGWRMPSIETVFIYIIVTAIGWTAIQFTNIKALVLGRRREPNKYIENMMFYAIVSAPLQELNARCYPYAIFNYFGWNGIVYVLFSAAIFAFSHIFLKNKWLTLATFVIGLIWSVIFYIRPDFICLSISHAILGWFLLRQNKFTFARGQSAFEHHG